MFRLDLSEDQQLAVFIIGLASALLVIFGLAKGIMRYLHQRQKGKQAA